MDKLLKMFVVVVATVMIATTGCKKSDDNAANDNGGGGNTNVVPTGAVDGLFSVSETQQVYFAQGNLQYQASTNTWRFAENQWDYIGADNTNISEYYDSWIDLFGWGTSGYNHGAVCYQPWSISTESGNYFAYGSSTYNLNDSTGMADWGYNAVINGGNQECQWRTLTHDEMMYVFDTRSTESGIRFAKGNVNGINGMIVLPDDWKSDVYELNGVNDGDANFNGNVIELSDWTETLEANGAVFLPAAGYRSSIFVTVSGNHGYYWTASYYDESQASLLYFNNTHIDTDGWSSRYYGWSVRLVRDK